MNASTASRFVVVLYSILLPLTFACSGGANAFADDVITPYLLQSESGLMFDGKELHLVYERVDTIQDVKKGNRIEISILDNRRSRVLGSIKAAEQEDLSHPDTWNYYRLSYQNKKYMVMTIFSAWDGEDPGRKPFFVITDGRSLDMKRYNPGENIETLWEADLLALISKFARTTITDEMRADVVQIVKDAKDAKDNAAP